MSQPVDYRYVLTMVAEAMREREQGGPFPTERDQGRQMGYFEALAEIVNQAKVSGFDLADIGLDGFTPEDVLVPKP